MCAATTLPAVRRHGRWVRRHGAALVGLGLVLAAPAPSFACPVCFSATDTHLLHTYYLSAVFLTLMPFLVIGACGGWIARRHRRRRARAAEAPPAVSYRTEQEASWTPM